MAKNPFKKQHKRTAADMQLFTSPNMPFNYIEAFKSLRTNLNFIAHTDEASAFLITSSVPEEAKTNTAVNLAVALAEEGKSVLLMDCDLRKPAVGKYLHVSHAAPGLTTVLSGDEDINDCLIQFRDLGITVLPAGAVPPNPSEILSSKGMTQLMSALRDAFDYIVVDTPPVSVVTDAAIIGRHVDGAILCVRSDFAPTQTVQLAKKRLDDVGIKIYGTVLTRYDTKKNKKQSGYSYAYDYDYYKE